MERPTNQQELLRLIDRAADEGWTELDLAGLGLEELPRTLGRLKRLEILTLGKWDRKQWKPRGNNLKVFPNWIEKLSNLKILYLECNNLQSLPREISRLVSLRELHASNNDVRDITGDISNLKNLKLLDLSRNKLLKIPKAIFTLSSLETLILGSRFEVGKFNQIDTIPSEASQLENLLTIDLVGNRLRELQGITKIKKIHLGANEIRRLSNEICNLRELSELWISHNDMERFPEEVFGLESLQLLDLQGNKIKSLPDSISQIKKLEYLYLGFNRIEDIPATISYLHELRSLTLRRNPISRIPKSIGNLRHLEEIDLGETGLDRLPDEIVRTQSLQALYLDGNSIEEIPNSISQLENLQLLNLRNNRIQKIPEALAEIHSLEKLDLRFNPLPISPEILGSPLYYEDPGPIKDIFNYFNQLKSDTVRPLNEAKLLLVGQGSVGKTSLINRLLHNTYDRNESQTDGLNVETWGVRVNSKDVRLNVWDFGGQEIYHATHQFFLTKRSLYLLVCNCRTSEEENRLEYWLKLIKSFGGESPVIIVGNKNDEQPLDINRKALRDKYPNIKAILETSCQTSNGIDELRDAITTEVGNLHDVYNLLPLKWFEVKEQLEAMEQDFISYGKYIAICEQNEIPEEQNQDQLIGLLHNLGLVLNYRDHPILQSTNVLNPDWVTTGIYALLSDDQLKTETRGIVQPTDLSRILNPERYPKNRHHYLTELMKEFQLGFELPNCPTEKKFLIPGLLPKEEPEDTKLKGNTLEFQYHYKVLPPSVVSRFIVLNHEKIHNATYWRSGVMLAYRDNFGDDEIFNYARIKADPEDKKIFISVSGRESTRRVFLSILRDSFNTIHGSFANPEDITEWVPVPDHPDADPLEYKELLGLEEMGETTVLIGKLKLRLDLRQLLDGYESREMRQRQQDRKTLHFNQTIQLAEGDNFGGDRVSGDKH